MTIKIRNYRIKYLGFVAKNQSNAKKNIYITIFINYCVFLLFLFGLAVTENEIGVFQTHFWLNKKLPALFSFIIKMSDLP